VEPRQPAQRPGRNEIASQPYRKQTYKEQRAIEAQRRELSELPNLIENLEAEQQRLIAQMAVPGFYQQDSAEISRAANRLKELDEELARAYLRWEELEN
jgi:ABC transport system ATP-binding/permease protein